MISTKELLHCGAWLREYANPKFTNPLNHIRLSEDNTFEHNIRVCEVCITLLTMGVPFYTEVRLKCGNRPDVVCPTHVKSIIEVFHTETMKSFNVKKRPKLPSELMDDVIFVCTSKVFKEKDIL